MTLEEQGAILYAKIPFLSTSKVKYLFNHVNPDRLSTAPPSTAVNGSIYMYQFSPDEDVFGKISNTCWSSNNLLWRCHGVKVIEKKETPYKYSLESRYYHSTNVMGWSKRVYLEETSVSKLLLVHYKFSNYSRRNFWSNKIKLKARLKTSMPEHSVAENRLNKLSSINQSKDESIKISDNESEKSSSDPEEGDSEVALQDKVPDLNMQKYYFAKNANDILQYITGNKCPLCVNVEFDSRVAFEHHFQSKHFRSAVFCEIGGNQACVLPCRKYCYQHKDRYIDRMRAHFHCPFCQVAFSRNFSFKQHLSTFRGNCYFRRRRADHLPARLKLLGKVQVQEDDHRSYSARYLTLDQPQATSPTSNRYFKHGNTFVRRVDELSNAQARHNQPPSPSEQTESNLLMTSDTFIDHRQTIEIVTDENGTSYVSDGAPKMLVAVNTEKDELSSESRADDSYDSESDDPADAAFLQSLLPDIRLMSHRQKSRFKKQTLSLVEEILYGSSATEPSSSFIE